jgi:hypothetical protein
MNGKDFSVYIVMNHESSWFGFLHWTAITTRDAYKLHVGYKYLRRYPPRRAGVWNPSTLLCLPSLEDLYFYFVYFFDFYKPHTRNHATRFIENNYRLRIWKWNFNLLKNIYHNLSSILPNNDVILSYSSGNVVVNLLPIKFFFTHKFYKIISLLKLKTNWIKYLKKVLCI